MHPVRPLAGSGVSTSPCVEMCPTGALTFGNLEEIEDAKGEKQPYPLHPEYGCKERVLYLNVPRNSLPEPSSIRTQMNAQKGSTWH